MYKSKVANGNKYANKQSRRGLGENPQLFWEILDGTGVFYWATEPSCLLVHRSSGTRHRREYGL